MKILKINRKTLELVCFAETLDDLWHLEKVIEKGDIVSGKTDRKIKPSKEGEKTIRQIIFIELLVEDVSFQEFSENLKINGIILSGSPKEYVTEKSHHSLDIKIGEKVVIKKQSIKKWQIDRLKKAEQESATSKLLLVIMDDEAAELAFVSQFSIVKKGKIESGKKGKRYTEEKNNYFDELLKAIQQIQPKKILVVGPGFEKDNFKKFVEGKRISGFPKILTETINSVGETGIRELLSQNKLESIEKELQLSKESEIIEEFLSALSKNKVEYGKDSITNALNLGAGAKMIVSETYLLQNRNETEKIMLLAENSGCELHIISSRNPQEKTIENMGGVLLLLRYRIE